MRMMKKIVLVVLLVDCFLMARLASANDEATKRLVSPRTAVEEKIRILTKIYEKDLRGDCSGRRELLGLIFGGHAEALSDSLYRFFDPRICPGYISYLYIGS